MYALICAGIGFAFGYLRPDTGVWKTALGATMVILVADLLVLVFLTIPRYGDTDTLSVLLGFLPFAVISFPITIGLYFAAAYLGAKLGQWANFHLHQKDEE